MVGASALETSGRPAAVAAIMTLRVRRLAQADAKPWKRLRAVLYPDCPDADHEADIARTLAQPQRFAAYGAEHAGRLVGLAELSLRDYVDGAAASPCGYLEGWYVEPPYRHRGIGRALVAAGEAWLVTLGVAELGSDAQLHNEASIAAHAALGFAETDRVVQFVKRALMRR